MVGNADIPRWCGVHPMVHSVLPLSSNNACWFYVDWGNSCTHIFTVDSFTRESADSLSTLKRSVAHQDDLAIPCSLSRSCPFNVPQTFTEPPEKMTGPFKYYSSPYSSFWYSPGGISRAECSRFGMSPQAQHSVPPYCFGKLCEPMKFNRVTGKINRPWMILGY